MSSPFRFLMQKDHAAYFIGIVIERREHYQIVIDNIYLRSIGSAEQPGRASPDVLRQLIFYVKLPVKDNILLSLSPALSGSEAHGQNVPMLYMLQQTATKRKPPFIIAKPMVYPIGFVFALKFVRFGAFGSRSCCSTTAFNIYFVFTLLKY